MDLDKEDEFKKCSVCYSLPGTTDGNGFVVFPTEQNFECNHNNVCLKCINHKYFNGKCPICRQPKRKIITNTKKKEKKNRPYHKFEYLVSETNVNGIKIRKY